MSTAVFARCGGCGTELAPGLLVCPACQRLVHSTQLTELATAAKAATERGDRVAAISRWREALELLPPQTNQFQAVAATVAALGREIDNGAAPGAAPAATHASTTARPRYGILTTIGVLLVSLLSKGKLLLLGLGNLSVLFSMLLSVGAYWTLWGWRFALGLVLSIYVHEMGHVAALRRYGMKATAPMFIPGLGALIRLQQHPVDDREDARIGLAGPEWGLFAAAFCWAVSLVGGGEGWAAIAKVGAWINLFNLIPLGSLDGGRAFRALDRFQRWGVVAALIAAWIASHEGLLILLAAVAVFRALFEPNRQGDVNSFVRFLCLIAALTALTLLHVSVK